MKCKLRQILRAIVGSEVGFVGEGCYQWYYTLYVAIAIMLAWRNYPAVAQSFTIVYVVEYVVVCAYGYFMLVDHGVSYSIVYLLFLLAAEITRLVLNWQLALISGLIGLIGILIAPNEEGQSFVFHFPEEQRWRALIPNTLYFALFVYFVMIMPAIDFVSQLIIIGGAMLLHPLIDFAEGSCMSYVDNLMDSIETIIEFNDERKDQKYQKQKSTNNHNAPD